MLGMETLLNNEKCTIETRLFYETRVECNETYCSTGVSML